MNGDDRTVRRRRGRLAGIIVVAVMGVLATAFFRAQVIRGASWTLQSDSNRLRLVSVPAPRGTVFDRYGTVVADNVPSYSVSLLPAPPDSIDAGLRRLQPLLGLDADEVATLMERARAEPRLSLLVDQDADYDRVAALEELRAELPGVSIEMRPKRRYASGPALGHVLGYVGEISPGELELPAFDDYEQRMEIGKIGLEREYERQLSGERGVRYVEVDAVGREVASFQGQPGVSALPGEDLELNLDLGLQAYIHEIFPPDRRGAVVALNVEDGGILALYSAPSFDPNEFVGGIDPRRWVELNADPERPLFNRAVVGRYPPASTWKVATAAIALRLGVLEPGEFMPAPCTGAWALGNDVRRCWNASGHGYLDLAGALAHSCNVFFYQVGVRVGLDTLVREGARFGFGDVCGVDLPEESSGVFPATLGFWEDRYGFPPTENEVLSLAIGQGPNDQTPLKMAQFYLALARDGSAPAPRIARTGGREPEDAGWSLGIEPGILDAILDGLRQVTAPGGTAYLSTLEHWDLVGKTGTAQQGLADEPAHAWFVGLAGPWGEPYEIVTAVIVEEGLSGSAAAAPVAAKAADFYLRRKYGIPTDSIQTLGEHYRSGVPARWAGQRRPG